MSQKLCFQNDPAKKFKLPVGSAITKLAADIY